MTDDMQAALDRAVHRSPGLVGAVAVATDRQRNTFEGAAGHRAVGGAPMTADTTLCIFSTTKAITGTAALQLVEEGRLDLDAPAKTYCPELGELQVLDGFDGSGAPRLRPPARDVTTRMLLLHTAGFGYDIFNHDYLRLASDHGQPSVTSATRASLRSPLLFDPGERWEYGSNMDWAGQVVEAIAGQRLGDVMRTRIFEPLGMADTGFAQSPAQAARRATMHARGPDGSLVPMPDFDLPAEPEIHMGGHGLYSTALDYAKFIRMWLNDGAAPSGRVLRPETVAMAVRNGLGDLKVRALPGAIPSLSNAAEFFPGLSKSWALSFMVNDEPCPTGRPAGSLAWAGLANLFFWIDRTNGIGGFWATQLFPFADPAAVTAYLDWETTVYRQGMKAAA